MSDVAFSGAVVGPQRTYETANYSAQDFETQIPGPVVPFTYDFQFGLVWLGMDFITANYQSFFTEFTSENFENLPVGVVKIIPATFVQTLTPVVSSSLTPSVYFNQGNFTSLAINFSSDDMETEPQGPVTTLTNYFNGLGDVTLSTGYIKPSP